MSLIRENEGDGEAMVPYVDIMTGELFMMPRSAITRRPEVSSDKVYTLWIIMPMFCEWIHFTISLLLPNSGFKSNHFKSIALPP